MEVPQKNDCCENCNCNVCDGSIMCLLAILLIPLTILGILLYNCYLKCMTICYVRGTRSYRILQLCEKYVDKIEEI